MKPSKISNTNTKLLLTPPSTRSVGYYYHHNNENDDRRRVITPPTAADTMFRTQNSVTFEAKGSTEYCLKEFTDGIGICKTLYPIYNWADRSQGDFWKRTWEFLVWGFSPSLSGQLVECYRENIKKYQECIASPVSAKNRIYDYTDDWGIYHKMGNCAGTILPDLQSEKILGCDGITKNGVMNPRYNKSKGKVINCDTNLPSDRWCACPGYPAPSSESTWNPATNKCECNNPAEVPHFHYQHNLNDMNGRTITCCGSPCDYGQEYDCLERKCKDTLYPYESPRT
jgi:hypothetical protein